jgi:hypothetical protein
MNSQVRETLLDRLTRIESVLAGGATPPAGRQALYQCERLRHAVEHAHAEGIRFASFTLGRLLLDLPEDAGSEARTLFDGLKQTLEAAGIHISH